MSDVSKGTGFGQELAALINRHSLGNESNTPDWILARLMVQCLQAFEEASLAREKWYGKSLRPGQHEPEPKGPRTGLLDAARQIEAIVGTRLVGTTPSAAQAICEDIKNTQPFEAKIHGEGRALPDLSRRDPAPDAPHCGHGMRDRSVCYECLGAEVERLERRVTDAREQALEEAANLALQGCGCEGKCEHYYFANAIRALKPKKEGA